ncbi:bleomycin resistance protein [Deinococcus petrolearius]|uniref:Bleomycin resistance protein n=1 Tax=Deinococcus petrolearius TaxID=1751295 RepID=A0ABW1DJF4_9DEIO
MSDSPTLPAGGFSALVPEFDVFDLAVSLDFWCGALGFGVAYARPGFAYLEREGAQVMLQAMSGEWDTGPLEYPLGRGLNVEIGVSSLAPLLGALAARGWPLFRPPRERWRVTGDRQTGNREFLVQDPNGYLLRFSEALGERPAADRGAP